MTPFRQLSSADPLERVRGARREAELAECRALEYAVAYAELNGPRPGQAGARLDQLHDVPLAGEGAPMVHEEAVAEFAAALQMSAPAARAYLGDALEVAHRLPLLWRRVRDAHVPAYRARMIAAKTHPLSPDAAAHVDAKVALIAHKVGPTRLLQQVDEAIALHDSEEASSEPQRPPSSATSPPARGSLSTARSRVKTHSSWRYEQIRPGVYLWRSPGGRRFSKTRHRTDEVPP